MSIGLLDHVACWYLYTGSGNDGSRENDHAAHHHEQEEVEADEQDDDDEMMDETLEEGKKSCTVTLIAVYRYIFIGVKKAPFFIELMGFLTAITLVM